MNSLPKFAVVGHPNKGKSSIVATLSHNDSIDISEVSGTTTVADAYPFRINGEIQYELVDTPGFQRPRQALGWLEKYASNAAERAEAVRSFIKEHEQNAKESGRFKDEIELLSPILDGAGIIYVVDGSVPYTPEYEAEMTILQWTGQPRMALINPIGGELYIEQWQQALGQYFSLVRVFNPMTAGIDKQLSILGAFAELSNDWKPLLDNSIALIQSQFKNIHKQSAYLLAEALVNILSYQKDAPLVSDELSPSIEASLRSQYQRELIRQEKTLRKQLIELYAHYNLQCDEVELEVNYPDMFDQDHWYLFGLTRQKLVTLATSAGAAAGALLDLGVGGASFMTGALTGGILSGAASLFLSAQPDRLQIKGVPLGGKKVVVGPVKNLQFAFVILGRSLRYQQAIASRAHANKTVLVLEDKNNEHWIEELNKTEQIKLTRLIQKASKGLGAADMQELQEIIQRLTSRDDNNNSQH